MNCSRYQSGDQNAETEQQQQQRPASQMEGGGGGGSKSGDSRRQSQTGSTSGAAGTAPSSKTISAPTSPMKEKKAGFFGKVRINSVLISRD